MKFHRARSNLDVAPSTEEQAAITEALLKQLNATLQNQPNAFAEAMGRKTLKGFHAARSERTEGELAVESVSKRKFRLRACATQRRG